MLGVLRWSPDRRVVLGRGQVLGLPVLEARLDPGGRWGGRRLERAARLLARQGVKRILPLRDFSGQQGLERRGLLPVEPLPLYRTMAGELALAALSQTGKEAGRAGIALRGERVDGDLARAARLLCPRVRTLTIQVPRGGEQLARELYWEFGAAVSPEGETDAAVRFSGRGQDGELVLCGPTPQLLGLEIKAPGLDLPEELEPLPVLTALWQAGRLELEQLEITGRQACGNR